MANKRHAVAEALESRQLLVGLAFNADFGKDVPTAVHAVDDQLFVETRAKVEPDPSDPFASGYGLSLSIWQTKGPGQATRLAKLSNERVNRYVGASGDYLWFTRWPFASGSSTEVLPLELWNVHRETGKQTRVAASFAPANGSNTKVLGTLDGQTIIATAGGEYFNNPLKLFRTDGRSLEIFEPTSEPLYGTIERSFRVDDDRLVVWLRQTTSLANGSSKPTIYSLSLRGESFALDRVISSVTRAGSSLYLTRREDGTTRVWRWDGRSPKGLLKTFETTNHVTVLQVDQTVAIADRDGIHLVKSGVVSRTYPALRRSRVEDYPGTYAGGSGRLTQFDSRGHIVSLDLQTGAVKDFGVPVGSTASPFDTGAGFASPHHHYLSGYGRTDGANLDTRFAAIFPRRDSAPPVVVGTKTHFIENDVLRYSVVTASGSAFEDLDVDGKRDTKEKPIAGARVFADLDDDGLWSAKEPFVFTASNGAYALYDLSLSKTIKVRVSPDGGHVSPGGRTLVAGAAEKRFDFALPVAAKIRVRTFYDSDQDRRPDVTAPSRPTTRFWLDLDRDAKQDPGEPTSGSSYDFTFDRLRAGRYLVRALGYPVFNSGPVVRATYTTPDKYELVVKAGQTAFREFGVYFEPRQ